MARVARPTFRAAPVRVRVPATSANLGPGFDALGLALDLSDTVVVAVDDEPGLTIDVSGAGASTRDRGERHLVVRALRATFKVLGGQPVGLRLVCANHVPHGRGLGSSAAAIVAGVVAARELVAGGRAKLDDAAALQLAARLEGHPDNVAPCLLGGLTIAWTDDAGLSRAAKLALSKEIAPLAFVPATSSSTRAARKLLPDVVPHADAARNAGRAALLVHALGRDPSLLLDATADWLHQTYRAPVMPRSMALVEQLRADGVPAIVSGAGPSVLALTTHKSRHDVAALTRRGWSAMPLDVDTAGATVVPAN